MIHHSFSRPVAVCFDLSPLIITYHDPQRFIAVRVIVYPLLILTYKFTKIKGFSKKFLKLSKAAFLTLPNRIIKHFLSYTKPTATGDPVAVGIDIYNLLSRFNLSAYIIAELSRTSDRSYGFDAERISRTLCKPLDSKRKRGIVLCGIKYRPLSAFILLDMVWMLTAYLSVSAFIAVYSLNSVVLPVFLNDFILKE